MQNAEPNQIQTVLLKKFDDELKEMADYSESLPGQPNLSGQSDASGTCFRFGPLVEAISWRNLAIDIGYLPVFSKPAVDFIPDNVLANIRRAASYEGTGQWPAMVRKFISSEFKDKPWSEFVKGIVPTSTMLGYFQAAHSLADEFNDPLIAFVLRSLSASDSMIDRTEASAPLDGRLVLEAFHDDDRVVGARTEDSIEYCVAGLINLLDVMSSFQTMFGQDRSLSLSGKRDAVSENHQKDASVMSSSVGGIVAIRLNLLDSRIMTRLAHLIEILLGLAKTTLSEFVDWNSPSARISWNRLIVFWLEFTSAAAGIRLLKPFRFGQFSIDAAIQQGFNLKETAEEES
jgi:hypothetical protein